MGSDRFTAAVLAALAACGPSITGGGATSEDDDAIDLCDGPRGGVWVNTPGLHGCNRVWVAIAGTLCGPGQYGPLGGSADRAYFVGTMTDARAMVFAWRCVHPA